MGVAIGILVVGVLALVAFWTRWRLRLRRRKLRRLLERDVQRDRERRGVGRAAAVLAIVAYIGALTVAVVASGAQAERVRRSTDGHRRVVAYGVVRFNGRSAEAWSRAYHRTARKLQAARRELRELRSARTLQATSSVDYWAGRQIAAATTIGRESGGDPWPNCPDPFDGGGSWYATVACENGGSWYDSPGYYRCGLQFNPMWEQRFGRLCP